MSLPTVALFVLKDQEPENNLAQEEALLEVFPSDHQEALWMVLYINRPCVVMGRHQNPLCEVRLPQLFQRRIPLLRRCTGGGTVWHDEGNVNVSFITSKRTYDRNLLLEFLLSVLHAIGFSVVATDKGDLLLDSQKISGHAYAFRQNKVLHHGTLLCAARLDELKAVLGTTGGLTEWIGVASRSMSVINLAEKAPFASAETLARVYQALIKTFVSRFGAVEVSADQLHSWRLWASLKEKHRQRLISLAWTFDQTPPFTWVCHHRNTHWQVRVEQGKVISCEPCLKHDSAPDLEGLGCSVIPGDYFFFPWARDRHEESFSSILNTGDFS